MHAATLPDRITDLIAERRPGFSLPQAFYRDPEIFELDLERIFRRSWIPVGPLARLTEEGSWFLFNLGADSLIIARGPAGSVHAMHNVCRHRGSDVCYEQEGKSKALVCPYHAWAYALDGALLSARAMGPDFDKSEFGLKRVPATVFHGTIMIYLGEGAPPDIAEMREAIGKVLSIFELDRARLAARMRWEIDANWKLVTENFGECYHCGPAHPEYCAVMDVARPATTGDAALQQAFDEQTRVWEAKVRLLGHPTGNLDISDKLSYSASRLPIGGDRLSQTRGGKPVAPVMGKFRENDGGITSARIHPCNYWVNACDHAVTFRFTPLGPQKTLQEISWLVHPDALPGRDYDVEELTWLWKVTTDEDKLIIDHNQRGINSSAYTPGPYAAIEDTVNTFVGWYLSQLQS